MQLTINEKNHPVKFDFNFQSLLCAANGYTKMSQLAIVFGKLDWSRGYTKEQIESGAVDENELEPTLDELKVLGEVIYYGLKSANSKVKVSKNDILTAITTDVEQLKNVIEFLGNSLVKKSVNPEDRGN